MPATGAPQTPLISVARNKIRRQILSQRSVLFCAPPPAKDGTAGVGLTELRRMAWIRLWRRCTYDDMEHLSYSSSLTADGGEGLED